MSAPPETSVTATLQGVFAAHVRDPLHAPRPSGIEPRRMQVYTDLFFNNIESLLCANFPVIRALYDDDAWRVLVRTFYSEHRCHTPLFTEIAREFIRWLEARRDTDAGDPPFLVELAHYEWSELCAEIDEAEITTVPHDPLGDVVEGVPVVSPLARVLAYRFPVHRISADFRPAEAPPNPTLILLTRDRGDALRFIEIDPLTALLFERLAANTEKSGRTCLETLLAELGRADQAAHASGLAILHHLRGRDALLGTRAAT